MRVFSKNSVFEEIGLNPPSKLANLIFQLAWNNLPLNPLEIAQNFFTVPIEGRLIAAGEELNLAQWKGLASQWDLWEQSQNCQIRLDRKLVLYLLSESLGEKPSDESFSCHSMTELEQDVLENFIEEIIENININLQDLEPNGELLKYKNKLVHLIWVIKTKNSFGKLAISLPIERLSKMQTQIMRSEEDCHEITLKINLQVGFSKMTLADLAQMEAEDFILLERSDKNCLRIGEDYAIPVFIEEGQIPQINLPPQQEIYNMNQGLNSDMLSNFPIEVKAEFRNVKITLKDLFALQSGWVLPIEQVTENELFLTSQDKTIARGELVISGDKFGILIKEVFLNQSQTEEIN